MKIFNGDIFMTARTLSLFYNIVAMLSRASFETAAFL